MLRSTVTRPVYLPLKHPSGARKKIFTTLRQLRGFLCETPSLTRWRVCRLQLLLAPASADTLRSKSRGTHDHILLSQIREPQPIGLGSRICIPPGTGWPNYTPILWGLFRHLLWLAGLRWKPSLYGLWADPIEHALSNNFSVAVWRVRCRGNLFDGIF
jgi:hypothetical protein